MLQRKPVAVHPVAGVQVQCAGRDQRRHGTRRIDLCVLSALLALPTDAQLLCGSHRQSSLGQHVTVVVVQRIGGGAAGVERFIAPFVVYLMALAKAAQQQALPSTTRARQTDGVGPRAVYTRVAGPCKTTHRLSGLAQVRGVQRAKAHRARQAITAKLGGCRAAQNLYGLDTVHIQKVAAPGCKRSERETIWNPNAVHQHQDLVALQATDIDAFIARTSGCSACRRKSRRRGAHRDIQFVAEHVLDVACTVLFNLRRRCHRDGVGNFVDAALGARRTDRDFTQQSGIGAGAGAGCSLCHCQDGGQAPGNS